MNSQSEQLNEELERTRRRYGAWQSDQELSNDPEVKALDLLARTLQATPPLQVDADFARHLERRVLAHSVMRQRKDSTHRRWAGILPQALRVHPALAGLSLCLLLIFLGTGVLVATAFVTNPNNPLSALRAWVQPVHGSSPDSPADQAERDLQSARARLNALARFANSPHAGQYRQALEKFDQQRGLAARDIAALPAGSDHIRLTGELGSLQADARETLRGLLLQLAVPERQATTDELGRLGDMVPHLREVDLTLPAHPNGQASISISGDDLQTGAALLVDGQVVPASGTLQNGHYLFTATWKGQQHPHSMGVMNPDGTVAQTTAITLLSAPDGNGHGNGNGGGNSI